MTPGERKILLAVPLRKELREIRSSLLLAGRPWARIFFEGSMHLVTRHGSVTVDRKQLGENLLLKVSDSHGYAKEMTLPGVMAQEINAEVTADIHRRFSAAVTRRN